MACTSAPRDIRPVTTVYVVRHAEKVTSDTSDRDPGLTKAGQARADSLASVLRNASITHIISTQYRRNLATADPIARTLGIVIDTVRATGPTAAHADSVAAKVLRHAGSTVLVVGHSNTVSPIIRALGGPQLADLCDSEHSNLFVLEVRPGSAARLVRQRYGADDPPPEAGCGGMR